MINLAGLHDRSAAAHTPPGTWVLDTVALSENPQPVAYGDGVAWIVRLNWGYGSTGTLPLPDQYNAFAQKCAAYVAGTRNCHRWIIGNEPNLAREWPDKEPIYPWHYAACYKLCRNAIHAVPGHGNDEVLVAASGPWNNQCKYEGNRHGDWVMYFADTLDLCGDEVDGFSLHAYTHDYVVSQVTDNERMDYPFEDRHYNFRTYQDYCDAIPLSLSHLPAYITEANGDGPWKAVGLIPAMLEEVDNWNQSNNAPAIHSCIFYRYSDEDHEARFQMGNKADVMAEYQQGVALGLSASDSFPEPGPGPGPTPPSVPSPPAIGAGSEEARTIDPALIARGVKFDFFEPNPGQGYWRVVDASWLDEEEADEFGPDHHILGYVTKDDIVVAGVPFKVTWPSGFTTIHSKADQVDIPYNYDYPMSSSLNEFSIWVDDGNPTDKVSGIGMEANNNPSIHTSTFVDWAWTIAEAVKPPIPVPSHLEYVTAPSGAWLRSEPVDGQELVAVPYQAEVTVDAIQQGSDSYIWKHSLYAGFQGWIRGDLLSKAAPPRPQPPLPPLLGKLVHPLPGSKITQDFYQGGNSYVHFDLPGHSGTDFGGKPRGTPVCCMANGVVEKVGFDATGYGNFVLVTHGSFLACTRYAHLENISVQVGQKLAAGHPVGGLGTTGNSTGVHLHLGVQLINADGSFMAGTPMRDGRVDPRTWAILNGLTL